MFVLDKFSKVKKRVLPDWQEFQFLFNEIKHQLRIDNLLSVNF